MIIDRIYERARIEPNKTAIFYNDKAITYAGFAKGIEVIREFLARQQLPKGSTAALLIQCLLDCWLVSIACRAIGLNTIALRVSSGEQVEIRDASCLIVVEMEVANLVIPKTVNAPLIVVPSTIYDNIQQCTLPAPLNMDSLYGGHFLYTSGTTGIHKKLLWPAIDEESRAAARGNCSNVDAGTVFHTVIYETWTAVGFKLPLAVWMRGGCVVIDQRSERFSQFFQHNVTSAVLLPAMLDQLVEASNARSGRSVRSTLYVGGAMSKKDRILRAIEQLRCDIVIEYAATELATLPLMSLVENEDDIEWLVPEVGRDVSIVDDEGIPIGPHREGFLRIGLTDLDFASYYHHAGGKSALVDGYFYPGDVAVKRADGRIRILGRVDDVINIQGQKIAAAPIEQRVRRYLDADEVCLFGHINDRGQEELTVAIQSSINPPQAKLDDIRKEFEAFELVRFHVLREFPRTDTGKVRRVILKNILTR